MYQYICVESGKLPAAKRGKYYTYLKMNPRAVINYHLGAWSRWFRTTHGLYRYQVLDTIPSNQLLVVSSLVFSELSGNPKYAHDYDAPPHLMTICA